MIKIHTVYRYRLNWVVVYCLPNTKQEQVAVNMLDAIINIACDQTNSLVSFMAKPTPIANTATMNDATVACTWTSAMFPTIIWITSDLDVIRPKFACVDRRDAKHMSKLPFKPSNAGTSINSSETCANTRHRYIIDVLFKIKWQENNRFSNGIFWTIGIN